MGHFDVHCVESGLPLHGGAVLILIAKINEEWVPCSLPFESTYDRMGYLDSITIDDSTDSMLVATRTQSNPKGAEYSEDAVQDLWHASGEWKGLPINYCLIDADIYHAIIETVAFGGKHPSLTPEAVSKRRWSELVRETFPLEPTRKVYRRRDSSNPRSRQPLIDLLRFRAWGTQLQPASEVESGQYGPGAEEIPPMVERARRRYSDYPLLLRAVANNAEGWHLETRAWSKGLPELMEDEEDLGMDHGFDDPDDFPKPRFVPKSNERVLPLRWLVVRRSLQGDQLIELSSEDLSRLMDQVKTQLMAASVTLVLEGQDYIVRLEPANMANFELDSRRSAVNLRLDAGARAELLGALGQLSEGAGMVALASLPGLALRA